MSEVKKKSYDWDSINGWLKIPRRQKRAKKAPSGETKEQAAARSKEPKVQKLMPKLMPKEPVEPVKTELRAVKVPPILSATVQLAPTIPISLPDTKTIPDKIPVVCPTTGVEYRKPGRPRGSSSTDPTPPPRKKNFCNPGPAWIPGPRPKIQVKAFGRCMKCWKVFQNETEQVTHDDAFHPTCKQCGLIFSSQVDLENHTKLQCQVREKLVTLDPPELTNREVKLVRKEQPIQTLLVSGANSNIRLVQNPVNINTTLTSTTPRLQVISNTGGNVIPMMSQIQGTGLLARNDQPIRVMRMDKSENGQTVTVIPNISRAKDSGQKFVFVQQNQQIILTDTKSTTK